MNTYYESFLRKDIFPTQPHYSDIVCQLYDEDETEKHYITYVLEDYIHGCSQYQAYKRLYENVIVKYLAMKKYGAYLDEEYKNKMKGGE